MCDDSAFYLFFIGQFSDLNLEIVNFFRKIINFLKAMKVKKLEETFSFRKMDYMIIIIVALLIILYNKWRRSRRNFDELIAHIPHYFKPLPVIGHGHFFLGDSQHILNQVIKMLTMPTPSKVWILHHTFILIKRPEDIHTILNSSKALEKHQVYKFMKPAMGEGLISAPAHKWKKNRKIIMPTFKQKILDHFVNIFYNRAVTLTDVLRSESGIVIDSSKYVFNFTLDVLCETALGLEINSQIDETSYYPKAIIRGMEIVWQRMFNAFYHFDFIFNLTKMSAEEKKLVKFQDELTGKVIKEKQEIYKKNKEENAETPEAESEETSSRKVFLEMLLELEETGVKFTSEELRDEVNTFMVAGTETTATSSSFLLQMLALHKNIQEKVYQEVIDVLGPDRPINYFDLPNLVYLEKVIKETLRLFPNVPIIVRTATDDLKLGKYIIPKGAGLVVGILPMMRSEEYYENPLEFNPERFNPEEISKRHPYAYLPFSGGPRSCIGMKYAMMVMKTFAATIVRKYYLETPYKSVEDIKLMASIVIKPVKGFPLKLTERK